MKKLIALLLSGLMILSVAACNAKPTETSSTSTKASNTSQSTSNAEIAPLQNSNTVVVTESVTPKYVFIFIGDGMSYPQFQAAADYLGAMEDDDYLLTAPSLNDNQGAILDGPKNLNFMAFEAAGSASTYDSNSFAPDSASTATSMATGYKTYSGSINVDETATKTYETITEQVHEQLGMKVGIISSVNINHATPAAFYAHQSSRNNYYEIGLEMIDSGFEYFAGGGLKKTTGNDNDQTDLYALAEEAGYRIALTAADAEQLTSSDEKVIIIDEYLADSDAMAYELDRTDDMWSLADYVEKGIEVLDNESGFFMMIEGGKIDWACHANDAASTIQDTIALADSVQVAIDFATEHPDETLIIVTGDHETGGMTIGFAGTDYDTYLTLLNSQTISYAKFDSDYVSEYVTDKASFETVLADIELLFGLKTSGDEGDRLVLSEYEVELLKTSYEKAINEKETGIAAQAEYVLYGSYNPLSVTISHILNHKAGISFTSYAHTGVPVAVFAEGNGADLFNGYYDNTEIYTKLSGLLGIK